MPQLRPRQTWEEFVRELEDDKERDRKAIESWRVQMREQRKPGIFPHWWIPVVGFLLLAGAAMWVFSKIMDAVIPQP